jgi:hypothetical protein
MYGGEGKIFYPEIEQDPGGKIIKVHTAEEWRGGISLKRKSSGRGPIMKKDEVKSKTLEDT